MKTLIELRERHGLSRIQLARRLGLSRQTIWEWEKGHRPIPTKMRRYIALALQAPEFDHE